MRGEEDCLSGAHCCPDTFPHLGTVGTARGHSSDLPLAAWVQSTGGLVHQDQARGAGLGGGWREGGGSHQGHGRADLPLVPPAQVPTQHLGW